MSTLSAAASSHGTLKKVSQAKLGVSEPNPYNFGNEANERNDPSWTNDNWLKSRFHFSFAEYYNPANQNFGVLRVMNDDLVQPKRGFGTHGHRDAEICTYVIEGNLTHTDSMGTEESLASGAIQFMTAGSGVRHSEHNRSPTPLRFIQMWLTPRTRGLTPNYGSSPGDQSKRTNQWHHMVSDVQNNAETDVKINTDANMFAAEIEEGKELVLEIKEGRQAYVLCVDGTTTLEDHHGDQVCTVLERHDSAEIVGPVIVSTKGKVHLLVVEMAHDASNDGRGDL
jgi:redox-sensitive bicupin YhaK (pirin superfamily)